MQAKLLRVLQEQELERIGDTRSASRAVFQQFGVPRKITVATPLATGASVRSLPWIGKFGL